ncbi:MAG: sugar phosphate isomerase/epimerase [Caldilineaceae bacterium]
MIGFVTTALFNWDLPRIVDYAVTTGFDGIVLNAHRNSPLDARTFDTARIDAVQTLLEQQGCGITAVADMSLNLLHPDEQARHEMIAYTQQLIDLSATLGVGLVSMFAGRDPEQSVEENIPRFREVFTPLADYAGARGVRIAFENCPLFEAFPYRGRNIAYAPAIWDQMFEAVPAANLGIELDTAHPVWLQQDLEQMVLDYAPRIFHIHFKDCHVDRARLQAESIYGHGWWSYETPGDGDVDWPRFFAALQAIRYNGHWTFDLKGGTRLTELPRGLAFVQPLLAQVFNQ